MMSLLLENLLLGQNMVCTFQIVYPLLCGVCMCRDKQVSLLLSGIICQNDVICFYFGVLIIISQAIDMKFHASSFTCETEWIGLLQIIG